MTIIDSQVHAYEANTPKCGHGVDRPPPRYALHQIANCVTGRPNAVQRRQFASAFNKSLL